MPWVKRGRKTIWINPSAKGGKKKVKPKATPDVVLQRKDPDYQKKVKRAAKKADKQASGKKFSGKTARGTTGTSRRTVLEQARRSDTAKLPTSLTREQQERSAKARGKKLRSAAEVVPEIALDVAKEAATLTPVGTPLRAAKAGSLATKIIRGATRAAPKTTKTDRLAARATTLQRKAEGSGRKAARARKRKAKTEAKIQQRHRKAEERMHRSLKSKRERAKELWKAKQPASLTRAGRKVKRRKRAAGTATLGAAAGGTMAPVAITTVGTTGEAVKRDIQEGKPLRTVGTTARVAAGMPAAVATDITDLAKSIAGDKEAWEQFTESQKDYYRTLAKVARGGEEGVKAVQEDVGLIPVISGGLAAKAGVKALGGISRPDPISVRRARSLDRKARTAGTKAEQAAAENKRAGLKASRRERKEDRTREAKRAAATKERTQRLTQTEMEATGKRGKRVDRRIVRLQDKPVTKDVSKANLVPVLGRLGLYGKDPDFILREIKRRRANLKEPSRRPRSSTVTTRDVYDAIIENPEILRDLDDVREVIRGIDEIQQGRSAERHAARKGSETRTPDPQDDRARLMHVADAEGILRPEEEIPHGLRGLTRVQPQKGQDAKRAIRAESQKQVKQAATLRRKARAEEAKARAARRELKTRRIADDRRVAIRQKNKKLRTLERRRAAWAEKVRRARRPDTRKRYEAKVRDLDRQIRDTKATLKTSASRDRLRVAARAARHRERAQEMRERAEVIDLEARVKREMVNRLRRAEALDRRATEIEVGRVKPRKGETPDSMRRQAESLRRAYFEDERKLLDEYRDDVNRVIAEKGYERPVFFRETDAADEGTLNIAQEYTGGKIPPKDKMRIGELARQGRIDESAATTLENLYRDRQSMEMQRHVRSFLDEHTFDPGDGKGKVRTGAEWRKLQSEGKLPPGMTLFPVQEWNRVIHRRSWEEAMGKLNDSLAHDVRVARGEKGKKYVLVPEAAKTEFKNQMDAAGTLLRVGRMAARVQSMAMLGLSPLWFAFQLIASPIATAFAHPNPARWAKVAVKMARDWRKIPKRERDAFSSEFGGTSADIFDLRDSQIALDPQTMTRLAGAARVANTTPVGRFLQGLARGGPLIAGNRRYEAAWRNFTAMLEADKQINQSRAKRAAQAVAGVYDETYKHVQHLKGKSQREIVEFYNRNPDAMRRLVDAIDDANGNWNALTKREKGASALFAFYPFLRFSNRWLLRAAPRNHPLIYAGILNLAQSNAMELDAMGEGDFFSDWGKGVIHGSDPKILDIGRAAPGGNALIELIGEGDINLATVTRPMQPLIGGIATALAGQTTLGQDSDLSLGMQLVKNALTLSAPTRPLGEKVDPPSDVSKMFRILEGRDRSYLEKLGVPDLIGSPTESQAAARLSDLLETASNRPSNEEIFNADPEDIPALRKRQKAAQKAQKEIDELKVELGLATKRELRKVKRKGGKNFQKVRYSRNRGDSFGSSAFSGSSGFGESAF